MKKVAMKITCPNCGEQISVDDEFYQSVVSEICNEEVRRRVNAVKFELETAFNEKTAAARAQAEHEYQMELESKKVHFVKLRAEKDAKISELNAVIHSAEKDKRIAVAEAIRAKNDEINNLIMNNELLTKQLSHNKENAEREMGALRARLENESKEKLMKLASDKDDVIASLNSDISVLKAENRFKDDQILSLRDYKARLSTKLLGEDLEQHCELSYDRLLRPLLPNAVFEKDTKAGEKGDFIFRVYDDAGTEMLSILFEMKNEDDTSTSRKKKNKDHFDKLDRDRTRRGCQIAVLVSTLEPDNDKYNAGITYVSEYDKMFVIRPQCFIDFIYLMLMIADDNKKIMMELEAERNKNIDIAAFEEGLSSMKKQISYNNTFAKNHCDEAIKQIENIIRLLEKHRKTMLEWKDKAEKTSEKAEQLSIKRLAKGNPTVTSLIESGNNNTDEEDEIELVTVVDEEDIAMIPADDERIA